jgi:hypothetical protein
MQSYLHGLFSPSASIVNSVHFLGTPVPNHAFEVTLWIVFLHVGVAAVGIIFGNIHVAAWNFTFLTEIEGLLWRVTSVVSTVVLPVLYSVLLFNELSNMYQTPEDGLLFKPRFKLFVKV